ncbi:MAG TPA: universal stress protein [Syntrophobacteraceae bacterium]|nr:universal stress protein [Syntrophobacteraceae bacterium]
MAYKTIVCGVTGSIPSRRAALEAAVLAGEAQADLVYVYAVDVEFLKTGKAVQLGSEFAEESLAHLGGHMLDFADEIAPSQGVTPKKVVRKGPVLDVLKQVVLEEEADLLVLGHEDRTFFEKILFKGSVEDHVQELESQTGVEVRIVRG